MGRSVGTPRQIANGFMRGELVWVRYQVLGRYFGMDLFNRVFEQIKKRFGEDHAIRFKRLINKKGVKHYE